MTTDLPHGCRIPGSTLFRVYCDGCGEPMRATANEVDMEHWCETCSPHQAGCSSPVTGLVDDDAYGVSTQSSDEYGVY